VWILGSKTHKKKLKDIFGSWVPNLSRGNFVSLGGLRAIKGRKRAIFATNALGDGP
jgi:hypothetical protein